MYLQIFLEISVNSSWNSSVFLSVPERGEMYYIFFFKRESQKIRSDSGHRLFRKRPSIKTNT